MDSFIVDKIFFLRSLVNLSVNPAEFTNNNLQVNLPAEHVSSAKVTLDKWNISYENIFENELLIKLSSIDVDTLVFFKELNFRQRVEKAFDSNGNIRKNIAVVEYKDSFLVYNNETNKTYINSKIDDANFLVENAKSYYRILGVLISKAFADYVNSIDKEMVLYSSLKGIKRIGIPDYLPDFDANKSIEPECSLLISKLQSSDFSIYFKNQLFNFINTESSTTLKEIVLSLGSIIQEADNNLQLYLKNFSFEKLKDDLQKEKEKYFSSLRDILGKILSQIVAIPISFAASVFATYKVADIFVLSIILVAFFLYSIFTYYLQSLYLRDVKEIESSFEDDFTIISKKSGLSNSDIDSLKIKIERRIKDIKNVIIRFRYLIVTLTIVFLIFIVYQVLHLV